MTNDPFTRPEDVLIAALLESKQQGAQRFYEFGPFRLDVPDQRLTRAGAHVPLPPKEFDTLLCLVEARGRLVTQQELLSRVWPGVNVEVGTIAQRISALRKALGGDEAGHDYIETVPRRGYRLNAEVSTPGAAPLDK
jgi:DNA-binding winged helix-turn-helix (wHTH) protein